MAISDLANSNPLFNFISLQCRSALFKEAKIWYKKRLLLFISHSNFFHFGAADFLRSWANFFFGNDFPSRAKFCGGPKIVKSWEFCGRQIFEKNIFFWSVIFLEIWFFLQRQQIAYWGQNFGKIEFGGGLISICWDIKFAWRTDFLTSR